MFDDYTQKDYNKDLVDAATTNIIGIIGWTYLGKLAYKAGHKKTGIVCGVVGTIFHLIIHMIWVAACYERFELAHPELSKLLKKTETIKD